jgi:iron complex outermembrane receptor protein
MFVNDANSASAPGYAVFNARFNFAINAGRTGADLTVGAHNLLDRRYAASVSVNAAAGKYFEPGLERSIYLGVTLRAASRSIP